MLDIAHIPTELWSRILTLACTDGGFTGRSLALTSKFFHSQSLSARFHSLALYSLGQIEDFLTFLDGQPKECSPRIVHLYLSFCSDLEQEQNATSTDASALWTVRFDAASSALLTLAAPTLRTLCVVEEKAVHLPLTFPCELPVLEELSWVGDMHAFDPDTLSQAGTPAFPAKLPNLRRVHFIHGSPSSDKVVAALPAIGSSLTHLRISDIDWPDGPLFGAIAQALGLPNSRLHPTPWDESAHRSPPLPQGTFPRLRHVILHGTVFPFVPWCGSDDVDELEEAYLRLDALIRACEGGGKPASLLLLVRKWRQNHRWPERLRDNWIDRMGGGAGCWVKCEEDEAALEIYEDDPLPPKYENWTGFFD